MLRVHSQELLLAGQYIFAAYAAGQICAVRARACKTAQEGPQYTFLFFVNLATEPRDFFSFTGP